MRSPSRSVVLPVLFVLLTLTSGCLAVGSADEPPRRDEPDRPPTLTAETAGVYAAQYEETYRHNAILDSETELVREIVVGAGVVSVNGTDDGFEVVVSVGFYYTFGDDGRGNPTGIADGRPYEATYRVTETAIERVGDTL